MHIAAFDESIFPQKTIKTECGKRASFENTVSPANGHFADCVECRAAWHSHKHGLAVITAYSGGVEFSDVSSKQLIKF
jgi:hypothetical protein